MAKFNVGDRVRMSGGDQGTILTPVRNGGNTVTVRFDDGMVHCIREADLLPATATKAMELRAKYKSAPSGTRFVVLWDTGDRDTCFGRRDLLDLLDETGCTVEFGKVIDKETREKVGTIREVS